jgi:hypothetical protein
VKKCLYLRISWSKMMAEDMGLMRTLLREWALYLLDSCRREESPGDDKTGELQKPRQTNRNVWFLPGSFGNQDVITRNNIDIPAGRKLFIVAASADTSTAEPPYNQNTPPEQLTQGAEAILDRFNDAYVEIDGQRHGLTKVVTEPFGIQFVDGNPYAEKYGVKAGPARMVCAARVAYVGPLSEGPHKITVYSRRDDDNFQVNVIDNVRVTP